jgi:hypothetical protein
VSNGTGNRMLVVVTSDIPADRVNSAIVEDFGEGADVRVVAPASRISRLDWLTNAEDDARDDAVERADEVAGAISPQADAVVAKAGDADPLQAIEDALRTSPADQIVFVTKPDDEATWLESGAAEAAQARFDLPVTHLVVG